MFQEQKIAFLEGFDYVNIGEVDPKITGYKLDPEKKELIRVWLAHLLLIILIILDI